MNENPDVQIITIPTIGVHIDHEKYPLAPENQLFRANDGDYGYDLACVEDTFVSDDARILIPTGVSFEFPPGWGCWLTDRSSTFLRRGLHVHLGKIDQKWREPVSIAAQCMVGAETETRCPKTGRPVRWQSGLYTDNGPNQFPEFCTHGYQRGQWVRAGERIGQIVFMPVFEIRLQHLNEKPQSLRGGWGSSGT